MLKPSGYLLLWIDRELLLNSNYKEWLPNSLKVKEILIWKNRIAKIGYAIIKNYCEYASLVQKTPAKLPDFYKSAPTHLGDVWEELVNFGNRLQFIKSLLICLLN